MAEIRTLIVNGTDLVTFPDNRVRTTKYNLITFLPYSLFVQFRRIANIYFLITAILQSIPEISPLHPFNAIAPLVFVLAVAMIRQGIQDYFRYKSDQQINATITNIYQNGQFKQTSYKDVKVGNLVKVQRDQVFPCDLVMLSNSNENGIAFIETSTLDGEKNLKPRMALAETQYALGTDKLIRLFTQLECDLPNPRLYQFSGKMMYQGHMCSLDKNHLLLSGAFLRNTDWAIGISVYTGNDTKLRQNLMSRRFKQSNIEIRVNKYIIVIILIQFFLCFIAAVLAGNWAEQTQDHWYLGDRQDSDLFGFLTFFTYFLLMNTMLPISLIISLQIIKLIQGLAMQRDNRMFSSLKQKNCKVSSFSLNQELGMIQHIFTDKTGTLTSNKMEFKFCSIGSKRYGQKQAMKKTEIKRRPSYIDRTILFTFDTNKLHEQTFTVKKTQQQTSQISQQILNTHFLTCLALCHECLCQRQNQKVNYIGQSPDQIALVDFARWAGCMYCDISSNIMQLLREGSTVYYQRIALFQFNSDRKRNSVIVKSPQGKYILYIKGADNEILKRLAENNDQAHLEFIRSEIHEFSVRGLRTLVVGYRQFSKQEFFQVIQKYNQASTAMDKREEKMEVLADQLERELQLLGCTAVEDALQAEVPATIADCLKAGIKVWMLTGDKLETAQNIGKTCCLLDDQMVIKRIQGADFKQLDKQLRRASSSINNNQSSRRQPLNQALIIEGSSLEYVLFNKDDPEHRMKYPDISNNDQLKKMCQTIRNNFFDMALECKTIICCRASPGQKREVVKTIKHLTGATTLAIGDGANDVSMILEAQIGIGLYGEQGMQAVQASDYAIGQFKFLWELLFLHGRYNYIRQSQLIMYFFYKNLVFTLPQFIFMGFCGYSGQTVYDDWYITLYNLIFTALPLLFRGLFDLDILVPTREQICEPELYHKPVLEQDKPATKIRKTMPLVYDISKDNKIFTASRFTLWMMNGCLHSILVFFIPYMAAQEGVLGDNGFNHTFGTFTITSFSCVILVVNIKLALNIRSWNIWHHFSIWLSSIILYFVFVLINDVVTSNFAFLTVGELLISWYYWGSLILLVCLVVVLDGGAQLMRRLYWPNDSQILMDYSLKKMDVKPKKNQLNPEEYLDEEDQLDE